MNGDEHVRCIAVSLTIPDNEALTALATLRRLGVALGGLSRADLYRVAFEPGAQTAALAALRRRETLFNANKHDWTIRATAEPAAGELWVAPLEGAAVAMPVAGVAAFERFTAWRIAGPEGKPADEALVRQAAGTLLCNFAFQRTTQSC